MERQDFIFAAGIILREVSTPTRRIRLGLAAPRRERPCGEGAAETDMNSRRLI